MTVGDLRSIVAGDFGLRPDQLTLRCLGQELADDAQSLSQTGIEDDSMLTAERKQQRQRPQNNPQSQVQGAAPGMEEMRQQALASPQVLAQIRQQFPELADAVHDPARFSEIFGRALSERQAERERMDAEIDFLDANPTAENQEKILERIRLQQVEENRLAALENLPTAFGSVTMLYIPAKVGTVDIKAFVDSGAQTTIMSPDCAERCGITHLIDKRYSGVARGVGTAKIVGRVHIANLTIGGQYLPCSFTVIEDQSLEFLLGLDMLKRHRASIDLDKNVLRIPSGEEDKADTEVPFLPESEIPKRDLEVSEPKVVQPDGTVVGTHSGAKVSPGEALGLSSGGPSGSATKDAAGASTTAAAHGADGKVKQLVDMFGCSEQEALDALRNAGGDLEFAASLLSGF